MKPDPVNLHAREHRRMREPIGERHQFVAVFRNFWSRSAEEARSRWLASARVNHGTRCFDLHDLLTAKFVFVEFGDALVLGLLVVDPGKETGAAMIGILRPALERMVLTLRTIELRAEKQASSNDPTRHGVADS